MRLHLARRPTRPTPAGGRAATQRHREVRAARRITEQRAAVRAAAALHALRRDEPRAARRRPGPASTAAGKWSRSYHWLNARAWPGCGLDVRDDRGADLDHDDRVFQRAPQRALRRREQLGRLPRDRLGERLRVGTQLLGRVDDLASRSRARRPAPRVMRSWRPTNAMRSTDSIGDFLASAIVSYTARLPDRDVRVDERCASRPRSRRRRRRRSAAHRPRTRR